MDRTAGAYTNLNKLPLGGAVVRRVGYLDSPDIPQPELMRKPDAWYATTAQDCY